MKKIADRVLLLFPVLAALCGCTDDPAWTSDGTGAESDGKYVIELGMPSPQIVETRAGDATGGDESVESAAVFVFDSAGSKTNGFVERSSGNVRYIDVYLTDRDTLIYVVCNHPDPEELVDRVLNLDSLRRGTLTIDTPDGANPGFYVMSGHTTVEMVKEGVRKVPLYRLASLQEFSIRIDTRVEEGGDGGEFKITDAYLCNLPRGSFLLDNAEGADDGEAGCTEDYVYRSDPEEMRKNYFESVRLDVDGDDNVLKASYSMFENRRGSMPDKVDTWPELAPLVTHVDYNIYKQRYKRKRAKDYPDHVDKIDVDNVPNEELDRLPEVKEGRFYNASYLRIEGVYRTSARTSRTVYHVYLGEDNFRDFNIRRNHLYRHEITIRSYSTYDYRVTGEEITGLTVYGTFDGLDAHFNSVKALMYSPAGEWTVSVKDPDQTPWLEVSHSAAYRPRIAGRPAKGDEAAFSIKGNDKLSYFYVHTDEYIPEINHPGENVTMMQESTRKGIIVCRSGKETKEFVVEQLPAQIVILHERDWMAGGKEIRDTFFIERRLERKYMPWGFLHYWSGVTDNMIGNGTWDGLTNTRSLYDVGLNGEKDKNGKLIHEPAYPDGLANDHALGYVVSKNRDRNGNGKIDHDEIVWYWPAYMELKQIRKTKFDGLLRFEGWNEAFYSSTPSASDKYGITPGLGVLIKMGDDSPMLPVQRDRKYNVLACRRKNAWKGPGGGALGGNIDIDGGWDGEDEVIVGGKK